MIEANFRTFGGQHPQLRRQRRMPIANLHFEREFARLQITRIDQSHLRRDQARRVQFVARPDHDLAGRRTNFAHIQRLAGGDPQAAPLPDGKMMHSAMIGERLPRRAS